MMMKKRGEIAHYLWARANGAIDIEGIDFQIYPEMDWCLNLQVKSSAKGKRRHLEQPKEWRRKIPCHVVTDNMSDAEVLEEVRGFIFSTIKKICERHSRKR